jgi:hypothetical protein
MNDTAQVSKLTFCQTMQVTRLLFLGVDFTGAPVQGTVLRGPQNQSAERPPAFTAQRVLPPMGASAEGNAHDRRCSAGLCRRPPLRSMHDRRHCGCHPTKRRGATCMPCRTKSKPSVTLPEDRTGWFFGCFCIVLKISPQKGSGRQNRGPWDGTSPKVWNCYGRTGKYSNICIRFKVNRCIKYGLAYPRKISSVRIVEGPRIFLVAMCPCNGVARMPVIGAWHELGAG